MVLVVMAVLTVKAYYHYYGDVTISPLQQDTPTISPVQVGGQYVHMGGYPGVTVGVPGLVQRLVQGLGGYFRGYVDIDTPSSTGGGLHPIPRVASTGGLLVGVGGVGGYQSRDENDKDDGMKTHKTRHNSVVGSSVTTATATAAATATATAAMMSSSGGIKENNGNGSSPLKRSNSIASLLSSLPMMALEKVPCHAMPCYITPYHTIPYHVT